MIDGVPLHSALVHFPIAAAVFGLVAIALATVVPASRRAAFLSGGALLLLGGALLGIGAAFSGRAWAEASGLLPGGGWIPPGTLRDGLARRHALLGLAGCLVSALGAAAAFRAPGGRGRASVALALALAASGLLLVAGHFGGVLVHVPDPAGAPAGPGTRESGTRASDAVRPAVRKVRNGSRGLGGPRPAPPCPSSTRAASATAGAGTRGVSPGA